MKRTSSPSALKQVEQATEKHSRDVRAIVLPLVKSEDDGATSKVDPWDELIGKGKVVAPPFDMFALATFPEYNSELNQTIEAMEVNIAGFGWQLIPIEGLRSVDQAVEEDPDDAPGGEPSSERLEYVRFHEFLSYGAIDGQGLTAVRRRLRRDLESTGNCYLELIDDNQGNVVAFNTVPSYQMRLGVMDKEYTVYEEPRLVGADGDYQLIKVKRRRRFRRYVQQHRYGASYNQVWFKECDDPRPISIDTGEVLKGADALDPTKQANPMVHMKIYSPRTPYGVPRYVGNILSILGGRSAEEINYQTFRNNNMPSMLLMVSNGALTQGTIERIQSFTESVIQGSDNWSKFLIVEADPDSEDGGQVKIEAQPLVAAQHSDAMFQEYDKNTTDKVRRAFRLPPIFVGRSDDYTRATAETSRRIGDEQVFAPERTIEDHTWNRILRMMGMKHHLFKTNTPNVTDDEDLIKVMKDGEKSGAVTPRVARRILEDILGRPLPPMGKEVKLDVPFTMQMAEAVKNKANPVEPGQQVTAMKGAHSDLMESIVKREQAMFGGSIPAVVLPTGDAVSVASGGSSIITLDKRAEVDGRTFALLDGEHCLAMITLEDPVEKGGSWEYELDTVIAIEPVGYVTTEVITEGFIDAVELS